MIVLDASAAVELLLARPAATWIVERCADGASVPHLVDVEVASALRRAGRDRPDAAAFALSTFADWELERYPATPFLPRIWQLRHALTAYDAAYVALAETLDVPLVTTDQRLARSGGHVARIEAPAR